MDTSTAIKQSFEGLQHMSYINYMDRWVVTEVWFCADDESWVVTGFDANKNILDESSDYYHRKADAVEMAILYMESDRCDKVTIFGKNGREQRTILKGE